MDGGVAEAGAAPFNTSAERDAGDPKGSEDGVPDAFAAGGAVPPNAWVAEASIKAPDAPPKRFDPLPVAKGESILGNAPVSKGLMLAALGTARCARLAAALALRW